ncbi:conserved hypothetical protein [uncultured Gammaproteobacteria bacterium]
MKVVIAIATAHAALRAFVSSKRDVIVPPEATANGYLCNARFSPHIFEVNQNSTPREIGAWLRRLAESTDGLILLIDQNYRHLAADYEDAYFVASLPEPHGRIIQNYIRSVLAPILRHFSFYSQRFDSFNQQRIFLLPLDVFRANDLQLLRARMTHEKMLPGFGQRLDELVAQLRNRGRPKTKTRDKKVYFVDDRPLWFRYGPEEHAFVETTVPPHHEKCQHNSLFRFGRAYNPRLHHNVDDDSNPTSVYGDFTSCHGQVFTASGQSHLDVFPNGNI